MHASDLGGIGPSQVTVQTLRLSSLNGGAGRHVILEHRSI
jgi:hypothetical protein